MTCLRQAHKGTWQVWVLSEIYPVGMAISETLLLLFTTMQMEDMNNIAFKEYDEIPAPFG